MAEKLEESPWKRLSKETRYDNPWIKVEEHQVLTPAGKPGIYGTVHFKNVAVAVVALDSSGNTWLVGQYRFPLGEYSWELPEGGGALGTDPIDSAKRELQEETGLVAQDWTLLRKVHLSNSVSDEVGWIFLARDLVQAKASPEETEQLVVRKMPLVKAWELVQTQQITDALSVIGLSEVRWGIGRSFVDP
jgi:8-oxo-dGTP pyrophosphatase MutT (NUDIX family)